MGRAVLLACLPWLALLAASCLALWLLARMNRSRFRWGRLGRLHADQVGSAQSLSFVLTLPLFILILLFIVQIGQLMIATMVVNYAAFAAARSAIVWIPAYVSPVERENWVGRYDDRDIDQAAALDRAAPLLDPDSPDYRPLEAVEGAWYTINPIGFKYAKIRSAAVLACAAVSPVREMHVDAPPNAASTEGSIDWPSVLDALGRAFQSMGGDLASSGPAPDRRMRRKLEYANQNTDVKLNFFHPHAPFNPPFDALKAYVWETGSQAFKPDQELGWEDAVTVTVRYKLALLPGPGRFLAEGTSFSRSRQPTGETAETLGENRLGVDPNGYQIYAYPIVASCTLGIQGEKSAKAYAEPIE